jgi:perosamine synthetase
MIPVSEPSIGKLETKYVLMALNKGEISSSGSFVEKFEKKWANYCDRQYGVAVSNGTVAIELAIRCLNLKKDDEIIMPSYTIISCAMAAIKNNLRIKFIDCDLKTWCIKPEDIEKNISKKTKAILIVNIFGHPCDMDKIIKIAKKKKLYIIEDAAESHGSKYKNKICGSFGDISTFSFYANKLITTGEGGMLLMNNKNLYEKAKYYRNLCFAKPRFLHKNIGYNFRLTNIQAAIGIAQIRNINKFIKKKIFIADFYNKNFKNLNQIQLPFTEKWAFNTYWMYGVVIKNQKISAKKFMHELAKLDIETRPFFYGLHLQEVLKEHTNSLSRLKNTEFLSKQGFYLPSGLKLDKNKLEKIKKNFLHVYEKLLIK